MHIKTSTNSNNPIISPLKARLVLRDLWSGRSSPVQRSLTSLSHVLGRDVACDPLWPQLLTNLDAVYSDESDFITAVAAVVQGWCGVVEEMLRRTDRGRKALGGHPENDRDDSDDDEADRTGENGEEVDAEEMVRRKEMRKEWEGNLIRRLKEAGAFALNLYLEVSFGVLVFLVSSFSFFHQRSCLSFHYPPTLSLPSPVTYLLNHPPSHAPSPTLSLINTFNPLHPL